MPAPFGPISAAHFLPAQFDVRRFEKRMTGIADLQPAGAQDQFAAALFGVQVQVESRRTVVRQAQGAHAALGLLHAEGGGGRLHTQLGPIGADHRIHAELFDGLHDARQPFELALGLQGVLPGNVLLDVLHVLEQFFLLALEDFVAPLPAFLPLLQVVAVVAAIGSRSRQESSRG